VVHRPRAGERVKARLPRCLRPQRQLEIKESKSTLGPTKECRSLGFTCHGTRIYWSPAAFQEFRHRVRKLTGRSGGGSMAHRISRLNEDLRGWSPSFGLSPPYRPLPERAAWLRRRLRRGFWKQGRAGKTKVRELLKLGPAKTTALPTALSRKGPGHWSRTLATQTGRTNQWRSETLGLVSIRALWSALHYPA
jgi:RNA-directed DNA polymerase